jgi:hypothetical protein
MPRYRWIDVVGSGIRVIGQAWLVCGVVGLLAAGGFGIYQAIWLARSVPAEGTIVAILPIHDPNLSTPTFAPRFMFRGEGGQSYTVTSSVRATANKFAVGEAVRVRYLRGAPSTARLDRFREMWLVPVVCASLGGFCLAIGYLLFVVERRILRRRGNGA